MAKSNTQQLERKLQRLQGEVQKLQAENSRLQQENSDLHRENTKLKEENRQQQERISELQGRVAQLENEVVRLQAELDAAQRARKRQAAPFSKGEPKAHPKKPGRKPGAAYGKKAHRPPPPPDQIDEFYEAPLPDACPYCGGNHVDEKEVAVQYQAEMPRRPIYRQFNVHIGQCVDCGRRVQGRHPLQTSDALGAAASQLGPQAQAAIVFLNKRCGMSHGKISLVLGEFFGLPITPSGVTHAILRAGRRLAPISQQIASSIRTSPWAVGDETGWKVGGRPGWLHVVVGEKATWFQITPSRAVEPALQTLGQDYRGVLVHDGYSSYERFHEAAHQQCVRHALARAQRLSERGVGGAVHFPRQVIALLKAGLAVRDRFQAGELDEDAMTDAYLGLSMQLGELAERPRPNEANAVFAKHLSRHWTQWFRFLLEPGVDATNWRAEQALRASVANRKVWGGNRTKAGSDVQAVACSVIETCRRMGKSPIEYISEVLCTPTSLPLPDL